MASPPSAAAFIKTARREHIILPALQRTADHAEVRPSPVQPPTIMLSAYSQCRCAVGRLIPIRNTAQGFGASPHQVRVGA